MTSIIRVGALSAALLLLIQADSASAQTWGRPPTPQSGACFYEDINYGGNYFCTPSGEANPQVGYRMNNRISSIRLFGNAEVTVYMERDFRGRSRTFGSDTSDLRQGGWNDRVTSFRVRLAQRSEWSGRWGRFGTPSVGACFYEHINFEGQYFCAKQGERVDMVPEGTNDRISSIRLFGGAEITLFLDRDFRGRSQHFETSVRDLRDTGWNDTLSSFRVEEGGFGRGGRGGQGQGRGQDQDQGRGRGRGFGGLGSESATGRLEWRGRVDDRLHIVIRGRSIDYRTVSGQTMPPGSPSFTSPLPSEAVRVMVEKVAGRGSVRVIQQPARSNDFTAIIEIYDPASGSQEYRLEVSWR